ncbi:hypothetical protein HF888_11325 [Bermanella marisrubri]|uniref:Uncharacterized protein n=1 Tax=Bermanella marisrubri TaxID=207949 RepID=Q1N182_9GAMM|nr:hypothetical protein [Bermanella marisrubri]EAT11969.1 hypothetical protein RED65_11530 [Oceanobacter sp. RED65] [Bermanella marisrubri]QIZ84773.1 hypothetical protein HF888_11325 [Bermanella marisrubri]
MGRRQGFLLCLTTIPLFSHGQLEPPVLDVMPTFAEEPERSSDKKLSQSDETATSSNTNGKNPYDTLKFLDWSRSLVSGYVESLNDGVDSFFMSAFFDDEVIADQSSGSNGRLYFISRREEADNPDYQVGVNLRLTLPHSRDRFKLLIETDENQDDQIENDILNTTDNVTYSTALRVDLEPRDNWRTSFDNGVRWSGEPVYFSRVRVRRVDYHNYWRTRLYQQIGWRTDEGWGAFTSVSGLMPLGFHRYLNISLSGDYLLDNDYVDLEASSAIFDELSERAAMLYQFKILGNTLEYGKVSDVIFSVSYRRKIYDDFIFAEIIPELAWPRDRDYEFTPAITFQLDFIFGQDD